MSVPPQVTLAVTSRQETIYLRIFQPLSFRCINKIEVTKFVYEPTDRREIASQLLSSSSRTDAFTEDRTGTTRIMMEVSCGRSRALRIEWVTAGVPGKNFWILLENLLDWMQNVNFSEGQCMHFKMKARNKIDKHPHFMTVQSVVQFREFPFEPEISGYRKIAWRTAAEIIKITCLHLHLHLHFSSVEHPSFLLAYVPALFIVTACRT